MDEVKKHRGHDIAVWEETEYIVNLEKKTFDIGQSLWADGSEPYCKTCDEEIGWYLFDEIKNLVETEDAAAARCFLPVNVACCLAYKNTTYAGLRRVHR